MFYVTDGENLVGVKLEYLVAVNDYLQPAHLASQYTDPLNAALGLSGYEVVGYRIKAGRETFNFGATYDDFGNTGGNKALAEGTFDGSVNIDLGALSRLIPIDLSLATPSTGPSEPLPESLTPVTSSAAADPQTDESPVEHSPPQQDGLEARIVEDQPGDTLLSGTLGAEVFKWSLAEPGAHDTIVDFSMHPPSSGGDVLDLRDLLPAESSGNLQNYLRFEQSEMGGTLLKVSVTGGFIGEPGHDATVPHQIIELANVNLLGLGSDQQIIETLISQNKLITE